MPSQSKKNPLIGLSALLMFLGLTTPWRAAGPRVDNFREPLRRLLDVSSELNPTPHNQHRSQPTILHGSPPEAIYDPDPTHIWNRLYRQFYFRTAWDGAEYGQGDLDPLLWPETKDLLTGPSRQQALQVLNEFLSAHAERLIADPLKRAMLQRDMWAIFDWLSIERYRPPRGIGELQKKVAQIIQRLALTPDQIGALPDTYVTAAASKAFPAGYNPRQRGAAFLPPDLFSPDGPWVCFGPRGDVVAAPIHTQFFSGRSVFLLFMRLPGGRKATLAYLNQLAAFPKPLIPKSGFHPLIIAGSSAGTNSRLVPNPDLPQFPPGTQVALVRRMMLIDSLGEPTPSGITESVQIRVFLHVPSRAEWLTGNDHMLQDVFEFRLSRHKLFANESGGLSAVTKDDREFPGFLSMPLDWLERQPSGGSGQAPSSQELQSPIMEVHSTGRCNTI